MWIDLKDLLVAIRQEPWAKELPADSEFWPRLMEWIERNVLSEFLQQVIHQVDEIVGIDPDLSERDILERVARYIVKFLRAQSASVRIYDPETEQMLSYGSFPSKEDTRETFVSLEWSIAGEVVKKHQPYLVPDILSEDRYQNKQVVHRRGAHSLMAVPLDIPHFFPGSHDTVGVIQIYFPEENRTFSPLEVQVAELMARRLSFVLARKRVLLLYRTNEKKEAIVQHIFRNLGSSGGVKMKEVFNRVIPELADMIDIQSCALFSITEDMESVILSAAYPEAGGYHSIGKSFKVSSEPAFELLLNLWNYQKETPYEVVTRSYILIRDPQRTDLLSRDTKKFAATYNINSILYIRLEVDGDLRHFMTFDALEQRQQYSDDEIDILLFLGRELMKAQKLERLDDALHDFKNPAIAIAGFARRLKDLVDKKPDQAAEQIREYADILEQETSRLQELALSTYRVGKEQVVDLTEVLRRRFQINQEAIREQLRQNVSLVEGPFETGLLVRCYTVHLERVFDNLLNNATNAIPLKGGELGISTFADGGWACASITNTGRITEEDRAKILEGVGEGRGLYITHRIIHLLQGKIEIQADKESTTLLVRLPLKRDEA